MLQIQDGQCGMCTHFGENQPEEQPKLIQIRLNHEALTTLSRPVAIRATSHLTSG